MPAVSEKQRRYMATVEAYKEGKLKHPRNRKALAKTARSMSESELVKFMHREK